MGKKTVVFGSFVVDLMGRTPHLPAELPVEYIPHTELKARSANAKAIILTGEFTGYTNVILTAGCAY